MSYLNYFLYVKDQLIIFKISLIKVFQNYHLSSLNNITLNISPHYWSLQTCESATQWAIAGDTKRRPDLTQCFGFKIQISIILESLITDQTKSYTRNRKTFHGTLLFKKKKTKINYLWNEQQILVWMKRNSFISSSTSFPASHQYQYFSRSH